MSEAVKDARERAEKDLSGMDKVTAEYQLIKLRERIAVLEAEAMDMSNAYTALLDAVKKAATPDGCPMDEWADGWNACCRSVLAALGGDHES